MYPLASDRVGGEALVGERLDLGRRDLRLEPLEVDVAIAGQSDRQWHRRPVGLAEQHDDVLQRVGGGPLTLRVAQLGHRR